MQEHKAYQLTAGDMFFDFICHEMKKYISKHLRYDFSNTHEMPIYLAVITVNWAIKHTIQETING